MKGQQTSGWNNSIKKYSISDEKSHLLAALKLLKQELATVKHWELDQRPQQVILSLASITRDVESGFIGRAEEFFWFFLVNFSERYREGGEDASTMDMEDYVFLPNSKKIAHLNRQIADGFKRLQGLKTLTEKEQDYKKRQGNLGSLVSFIAQQEPTEPYKSLILKAFSLAFKELSRLELDPHEKSHYKQYLLSARRRFGSGAYIAARSAVQFLFVLTQHYWKDVGPIQKLLRLGRVIEVALKKLEEQDVKLGPALVLARNWIKEYGLTILSEEPSGIFLHIELETPEGRSSVWFNPKRAVNQWFVSFDNSRSGYGETLDEAYNQALKASPTLSSLVSFIAQQQFTPSNLDNNCQERLKQNKDEESTQQFTPSNLNPNEQERLKKNRKKMKPWRIEE